MMVRVGLADGCPLIRDGLRELLRKHADLALTWEVADPAHVQDRLSKRPVQLLVIEPFVHRNADPLRLLGTLHHDFQKTALLVYTSLPGDDFAINALRAGAAGVLNKTCPVREILSALSAVAHGKTYLSAIQARQLSLQLLEGPTAPDACTLTPREQEVLNGIADGKRLKEMGAELSLSLKTVHTYKTRIMEKFHLESNADLIRFAQNAQNLAEHKNGLL